MGRSFLTILSRYGNAELVHDSPYNRPKAAGASSLLAALALRAIGGWMVRERK
jgi:hypothetical protein